MTATSACTGGADAGDRDPFTEAVERFVVERGRLEQAYYEQPMLTEQLMRDLMEKIRSQRTNVVANAATAERLRTRLEEAGMLHRVNILENEYAPDDTAYIMPPEIEVKIEGRAYALDKLFHHVGSLHVE